MRRHLHESVPGRVSAAGRLLRRTCHQSRTRRSAYFDENSTSSYMQRWQFAVQRQLLSNSLIEVSYVGNRGTRMRVGRDLNAVPAQYLSTSPVRDRLRSTSSARRCRIRSSRCCRGPGLAATNVRAIAVAPAVSAVHRREHEREYRLLLVSLVAGAPREAILAGPERVAVLHVVENDGSSRLPERVRNWVWRKSSPARTARIARRSPGSMSCRSAAASASPDRPMPCRRS